MIVTHSPRVVLLLICGITLTACAVTDALSIQSESFAIGSVPLPANWEETYRGTARQPDGDVVDSWRQRWQPVDSDIFTRFSFSVDRFESIALAKGGFRRSLERFHERGFRMEPLPEWAYDSSFADQYAMYCSWPETTGEFCYSVARYVNLVVIVGLDPGNGVTLEQAPELFGIVDQRIHAVIESAGKE